MGQKIKAVKWKCVLRKAGIVLLWLLVWHFLALWVDNDILMVTPLHAGGALWELMGQVKFWQTIGMSLLRIGAGFVLGAVTALSLAALSSRFRLVEEVLAPVMTLCKAVPVASFVVLLLIWWGSEYLAVSICFLIVLPNLYISTLEGLKNTDGRLLEMASVFRLPFFTRFFYIYRPALKPFLDSSLKLSLGMCWKSGVAAEVIGTPDFSIGERLYMSKIYLDTAGVFAWTAVIILLSIGFEKLVLWLEGLLFAWEPACKEAGGYGFTENTVQVSGVEKLRRVGGKSSAGMSGKGIRLLVRKVSKSYGEQKVISDFSAGYDGGSVSYLTGPSGSGKTTLLRLLCGLEQPDSGSIAGEVLWNGKPEKQQGACRLRYSMVFQENRLCEDYSALRNVEMVTGSRKRALTVLKQLLEEEALYKPCSQLSGGMKRRVALVRAMESASEVVLLDEPFTGMDAETRSRAEAYIQANQRGRVLIIATHI